MKEKKQNMDDPKFQIKFYEGVLQKNPKFIEALSAIGDLYTQQGFFQKGLEIDLRLAQIRPEDPVVMYNLSCSYSLLHRIDESLATMQLAMDSGYKDFDLLEADQDLTNLRNDQRFQDYYKNFKKNRIKQKKTPQ